MTATICYERPKERFRKHLREMGGTWYERPEVADVEHLARLCAARLQQRIATRIHAVANGIVVFDNKPGKVWRAA